RITGRASWALGHEVRLMPTQYVKAYIKRNKHDAADAEAICEAVSRPTMRFVPVKTAEQQATALLHHGREQLVRQRTMLVNALRANGDQPPDRQGSRPRRAAYAPRPRRRGDRVSAPGKAGAIQPVEVRPK